MWRQSLLLLRGLPFEPMALTTLDSLTQKLEKMKSKEMIVQIAQMQSKALKRLHSSASNANTDTQAQSKFVVNPPLMEPLLPLACKWFESGNLFFISPKHDGVRLISYVPTEHLQNKNKVCNATDQNTLLPSSSSCQTINDKTALMQTSCYTRYGRPLYGVFWLEPELNMLRHVCGDLFLVLDGELYIHRNPEKLAKDNKKKKKKENVVVDVCKNNFNKSRSNSCNSSSTNKSNCTKTHENTKEETSCANSNKDGMQHVNEKCSDLFKTGFLAVSSLVHRLRGSAIHSLTMEDVLQFVSTLPSYCVFDVASYCPPSHVISDVSNKHKGKHKKAQTKFNKRIREEAQYQWCECLGTSLPSVVIVEIEKIWRSALEACKVRNVEELRVLPNVTPFSLRLRTLHFLFTLLTQAYSNTVLHNYFIVSKADSGSSNEGRAKNEYTPKIKDTSMYIKRIPYHIAHSLDEAQNVFLPKFLNDGYEGAVIRSPMNVYEMKEKSKNVVSELVSPSERTCCCNNNNSTVNNEKLTRQERALASQKQRRSQRKVEYTNKDCLHEHIYYKYDKTDENSKGVSENNKCSALCHAAIELSRCLPPRSHSVVKLLAFKDTEYAVLRPLLKLPSTNPRSRPLVEIPLTRLHKSKETHDIKWNTHDRRVRKKEEAQLCAATTNKATHEKKSKYVNNQHKSKKSNHNHDYYDDNDSVECNEANSKVAFYGLQCVAENGRVFNVSLPKMTAEQQEMLLTHLLQTSKRKRKCKQNNVNNNSKSNSSTTKNNELVASATETLPLTGLYVTVKYSTLTEHGIPRFASVKAIRGGKGWFM